MIIAILYFIDLINLMFLPGLPTENIIAQKGWGDYMLSQVTRQALLLEMQCLGTSWCSTSWTEAAILTADGRFNEPEWFRSTPLPVLTTREGTGTTPDRTFSPKQVFIRSGLSILCSGATELLTRCAFVKWPLAAAAPLQSACVIKTTDDAKSMKSLF